jgi:hypothetical protein
MANYRENTYARTRQQPVQVEEAESKNGEKQIPVNGYQQVIEMLEAADPAFRESLLRRLSARDPELGRSLRAHFA